MKYRIYGYDLNILTNDDVIITSLTNFVGHFCDNEQREVLGYFLFSKVSMDELYQMYCSQKVGIENVAYVQPTGEYAKIFVDDNYSYTTHYYERYYLIKYIYSEDRVEFYYTEKFYNILELLIEFFKYYIFRKAVDWGKFPLHSSCISNSATGKSILFVGDSGSGKSSNALLASINGGYKFYNDEVTYITKRENHLVAIPTADKIKICKPMFVELSQKAKEINGYKMGDEYICCFPEHREWNIDMSKFELSIDKVIILSRDDRLNEIRIGLPNKLQKYEILLRNFHVSAWTSGKQKRTIFSFVDEFVKKIKIVCVSYPTHLMHDIINYLDV